LVGQIQFGHDEVLVAAFREEIEHGTGQGRMMMGGTMLRMPGSVAREMDMADLGYVAVEEIPKPIQQFREWRVLQMELPKVFHVEREPIVLLGPIQQLISAMPGVFHAKPETRVDSKETASAAPHHGIVNHHGLATQLAIESGGIRQGAVVEKAAVGEVKHVAHSPPLGHLQDGIHIV
jgi:hypothetical protein